LSRNHLNNSLSSSRIVARCIWSWFITSFIVRCSSIHHGTAGWFIEGRLLTEECTE
jgi:hypothetical protein